MKPLERAFAKAKSKDWCAKGKRGRKRQRNAARHRSKLDLRRRIDSGE